MNLANSITQALDSTARLLDAVVREKVEICPELVESRLQTMTRFESCHRAATDEEKDSCSGLLKDLLKADQELQEASTDLRDRLGEEYRTKMSSGPLVQNAGYANPPKQACLDRKA